MTKIQNSKHDGGQVEGQAEDTPANNMPGQAEVTEIKR